MRRRSSSGAGHGLLRGSGQARLLGQLLPPVDYEPTPLRWSVPEAFRFLGDIPELEHAGVVVRMPAIWRAGRPARG